MKLRDRARNLWWLSGQIQRNTEYVAKVQKTAQYGVSFIPLEDAKTLLEQEIKL